MFDQNTAKEILAKLQELQVEVVDGLTESELKRIEELLSTQLPPELRILLSVGVPVSHKGSTRLFPQWHHKPEVEVAAALDNIEKAFTFDIENSGYWHSLFGDKPKTLDQAKAQALQIIRAWPPLIRVYGHRYVPSQPHELGNPIISVWQATDSVYYASNLTDYFVKEFGTIMSIQNQTTPQNVPFWSEAFNIVV